MLYPLSYGGAATRLSLGVDRVGNPRDTKIVRTRDGHLTARTVTVLRHARDPATSPGRGRWTHTMDIRVQDTPDRGRFEALVGDRVVGLASYHVEGDVMTLPHTEVDPAVAGRGVGTVLVREVLAAARERQLTVLPYCSFVRHYLHEHPADVDLVAEADRPHFGLELTSS